MELLAGTWWVVWVILGIIFYGMFIILYQIFDIFYQRKHSDEIEEKLSRGKFASRKSKSKSINPLFR